MANLTRYLQKIFAKNSNQIGVFGTGVNKETSTNVETLQSAKYEGGWSQAIVTNKNYPVYQEMDGVMYGMTYQLAYLLQKGIPEWLATETYYQNDYCKVNGIIFKSNIDNNTNHNPSSYDGTWSVFTGNNTQITNCTIEIPQNITYTLSSGALTLPQGTVVIVPYGTTDQSSTYPVGSTFINSNLKVVNTEYTDGKFFVWVELQTSVTRASSAGSGTTSTRTMALSINNSDLSIVAFINTATVTSDGSAPSSSLFLNTSSNLVKSKQSGTVSGNTCSLPIGTADNDATYNIAKINQIYNGLGVIGTTIWADKGVRGLRPNGINNDGTLNNTLFTTSGIQLIQFDTSADAGNRNVTLGASSIGYGVSNSYYYNAATNRLLYEGENVSRAIVASFYFDGSNISNFYVYQPLNLNTVIDGQWISKSLTVVTDVTAPVSTNITYSLANYLPNDGYNYEVLICGSVITSSTSGSIVRCYVASSILTSSVHLIAVQTRSSSSVFAEASCVLLIGPDRTLILDSFSGNAGKINLYLRGYRRIGTNL